MAVKRDTDGLDTRTEDVNASHLETTNARKIIVSVFMKAMCYGLVVLGVVRVGAPLHFQLLFGWWLAPSC